METSDQECAYIAWQNRAFWFYLAGRCGGYVRLCVFLVLFFVFSSVVIPSLPAHTLDSTRARFALSTFCSPMHIHVAAHYVGHDPDNLEIFESERKQRELTAFVKRRLVTARLYQERAENYIAILVMRHSTGAFHLSFNFWKLLYDRPTQSWNYATTWGFQYEAEAGVEESDRMAAFSGKLDSFLEQYVDVNKNSCSP